MFQSTGLFGQIKCPDDDRCQLLNCIFQHKETRHSPQIASREHLKSTATLNDGVHDSLIEPPRKRQKLSTDIAATKSTVPPVKGDPRVHSNSSSPPSSIHSARNEVTKLATTSMKSTQQRISPPPAKQQKLPTESKEPASIPGNPAKKQAEVKPESLNPRLVPKPPANHPIRTKLLRLMHEQLQRLNDEVIASKDDIKDKLKFTPQELIKMALDEEEWTAKFNMSVYSNIMKLRITALKKMNVEGWREERLKVLEQQSPKVPKPVEIVTGLTSQEEILLLPNLITSQDGLAQYGYVTSQIPEEDIEKARQGVESAHGYEVCDRCGTRFQVFPGRREDGMLTTGGSCTYHFGRLRRPPRVGAPVNDAERYTCCQDAPGSKGCEVAQCHVFKVSDPNRLALVVPFKETPTAGPRITNAAVCFDCEMGYTTYGLELIRLTATEWPGGKELLDVLVRPRGEILDLNSRFSGVWPEEYTKAVPYGQALPGNETTDNRLRIADSPSTARDLLFEHLTTTTPLIGHALENDLNAARILHPAIIDTVVLFPHPRGLPIRNGLKALMKRHLNKNIQMGGAQGHDSKEDARAAGELARLKVAERWKKMRQDGWTVMDGEFIPPKVS